MDIESTGMDAELTTIMNEVVDNYDMGMEEMRNKSAVLGQLDHRIIEIQQSLDQ